MARHLLLLIVSCGAPTALGSAQCKSKARLLSLHGGAGAASRRPYLSQPVRTVTDTGTFVSPADESDREGEMSDAERVYVLQQFSRPEVRKRFLARVYAIVAAQVAVSTALVALVRTQPALLYRLYPRAHVVLMAAWAPAMFLQLSRERSRRAPVNYILLFLFTALTALGLGAATAGLPTGLMLRAGGATLVAALSLSAYAIGTRRDFTVRGGMLTAGLLSLMALSLLQIFVGGSLLSMAHAYLGVVIFSGYLVHDTQRIVGGGKEIQLRADEHVLGALTIFTDLLNLFLYILRASLMENQSRDG